MASRVAFVVSRHSSVATICDAKLWTYRRNFLPKSCINLRIEISLWVGVESWPHLGYETYQFWLRISASKILSQKNWKFLLENVDLDLSLKSTSSHSQIKLFMENSSKIWVLKNPPPNKNQCSAFFFVENRVPVITSTNNTFRVKVGMSYPNLEDLEATDADNDTLTWSLNQDAPSGLAINSSTGVLSWMNVPDISSATITIQVSDGKVSVNYDVFILLCKCQVWLWQAE